jgi:hypothetical protein
VVGEGDRVLFGVAVGLGGCLALFGIGIGIGIGIAIGIAVVRHAAKWIVVQGRVRTSWKFLETC